MKDLEQHLTSANIPNENVTSVAILDYENIGKIDSIPSELFTLFPKLLALDSNIVVPELSADTFVNATELVHISLKFSKIRKFSASTFQTPKLEFLTLAGNEIEQIEDNSFSSLSALQTLFLYKNKLKTISRNTFAGLTNLLRLELFQNEIQTIENGAFADLKKLQKLTLDDNKIVEINSDLYTLTALRRLQLSNNPIDTIDLIKLGKLPNLVWLNLTETTNTVRNFEIYTISEMPTGSPVRYLNLGAKNRVNVANLKKLGRIFPHAERVVVKGDCEPEEPPKPGDWEWRRFYNYFPLIISDTYAC